MVNLFIMWTAVALLWLAIFVGYPVAQHRIKRMREVRSAVAEERTEEAAIADLIVVLLQARNEWIDGRHHMTLVSPFVSLWVANEDYGLGVSLDQRDGEAGPASDPHGLSLPPRQRRKIWKAVQERRARLQQERSARLMSTFAEAALAAARHPNPRA